MSPLAVLLLTLMVAPPIVVFTSLPWLREQPDEVGFLVSGVAATLTVVASLALGLHHNRRLDEWHRSAAQFSSRWGWTAGASLVALVLAWPAGRDLVVSLVAAVGNAGNPDQELVVLAFVMGFMVVVLAQVVCTAVLAVGWSVWMSRAAREP